MDSEEAKVRMAIERFLATYPLLGALVAMWELVRGQTDTMAIGFGPLGFRLYYSPEFVKAHTLETIVGVLHHEARHILFGHLLMDETQFSDENALLIAMETCVNEGIPEPLPTGVMRHPMYKLPPNEDTEARYRRLEKRQKAPQKSRENGNSASKTNTQLGPIPDDHAMWKQVQERADQARADVASALQKYYAQQAGLVGADQEQMEEVCAQWGLDPGKVLTILPSVEHSCLQWQTVLQRFAGQVLKRDYSLIYPSRRAPHLVGIVPGRRRQAVAPRVLAGIDTSASMSDEMLAEIAQELQRLGSQTEVLVVEFDCEVQRTYRFRGRIDRVQGRGGTDFRPVLEDAFLRQHRPDLVLLFTDGEGPAPEQPPKRPLLWVLTVGGSCPVAWGNMIQMHES